MASDETVDVQTDDPKGRSALKPYAQRKPPPARRERRQQDRPQRQSGSILGPQWDGFDSFSVEQVASILGLSRWAAYQAVGRGEIPTVKIGGRLICPRHAVEKLLSV
jgi:excisionase family DNA binding protein